VYVLVQYVRYKSRFLGLLATISKELVEQEDCRPVDVCIEEFLAAQTIASDRSRTSSAPVTTQ
jgi:hypothetical protein